MKTAIALSGGADSLYSLAGLKERGQDVLAVHAFFLPPDQAMFNTARSLETICSKLQVPLKIIDLSREFREKVINPFIAAYKNGFTPNPCSICNQRIKFGLLLEQCLEMGAQTMATGHYARVESGTLWRGQDTGKDQSYFLALVAREKLKRVFLPLGTREKKDILSELQQINLAPVHNGESQEVCFIPGNYREFLTKYCPDLSGPGPIIGPQGNELGRHRGLWAYTPGQRRGLGIAYEYPLYVIGKNMHKNQLIVGPREALNSSGCELRDLNILIPVADWPKTVFVQTRYRQQPKPSFIGSLGHSSMRIIFIEAQKKPAPGQIAAIYSHAGQVLGAGKIVREIHG